MVRFLATCLAVLAATPAAAAAHGFQIGFFDGQVGGKGEGAQRLDDAVRAGAHIMRVPVSWPGVAPERPLLPRDPADPAYRWGPVDAAVAAVRGRGLSVLLSIDQAAPWAQAADRPDDVRDGAWKPDPAAIGDFAAAVAARYRGQVSAVQLFNEPNLDRYLAPQWERRDGRWRPVGPDRYRAMLNAAYPGVHAAGLRLVTAGTGPYGDPDPGGGRIMPVRFWRRVLSRPVRFDVLAHHPYGVGGPFDSAPNRDDVAVPDLGKLRRVLRAAERRGSAPGRHALWVTEVSWDSYPDPDGLSEPKQARWLAEGLFALWRAGVEKVFWFQVRDQAPVDGDYGASNQSGVYEIDGTPKLSQAAFRFPFACRREHGHTVVWALAPGRGRVTVFDRHGQADLWLRAGRDRIATGTTKARGPLTAAQGADRSLPCRG